MAQITQPLPRPDFPIVDPRFADSGRLAQAYILYFAAFDATVRAFVGSNNLASAPQVGPLVNAANDAAAAAANVPVGGLYRTGNAVQIRLV